MESPSLKINGLEKNKQELVQTLHEYQKHFDIWGHGVVSEDVAENILKEGLHTQWKALHDLSYKIPENDKLMLHRFEGWDYNARKYIILIASPKGLEFTDYGGFESRQRSINTSNTHIFSPSENGNLVPKGKIIGYVDVNTFKLVVSPDFAAS